MLLGRSISQRAFVWFAGPGAGYDGLARLVTGANGGRVGCDANRSGNCKRCGKQDDAKVKQTVRLSAPPSPAAG
jgi:hypothetical protein